MHPQNSPNVMRPCAAGLLRFRFPAIPDDQKNELADVIAQHARSVSHARAILETFTAPPAAEELRNELERTSTP